MGKDNLKSKESAKITGEKAGDVKNKCTPHCGAKPGRFETSNYTLSHAHSTGAN